MADLRIDYGLGALSEADLDPDPIKQFGKWLNDAVSANLREPNAMTVATATADGTPSARIVLLRGVDERGFVFYTNYESRKAHELAENPKAALIFYWAALERQVRVTGTVERTSHEESEAYFKSRPLKSRLGAWASPQSQTLPSRAPLEARLAEMEQKFSDGEIPLPPFWGGYRVKPQEIEFWHGRRSRLHDRLLYSKTDSGWKISRLAP